MSEAISSLAASGVPQLLCGLAILALGMVAVVREGASRTAVTFFAFTALTAGWPLGLSGMLFSETASEGELWARFAYIAVPLIPAAAFQFSSEVLGTVDRRRKLLLFGWIMGVAFTLISQYTNLLVAGVYEYSWGYHLRIGPLAAPFLAYLAFFLIFALYEFHRESRAETHEPRRRRIRIYIFAFAVGYVALIDFVPTFGIALYPFGFLGLLGFVGLLAHGIRRYRLTSLTPAFAAGSIVQTIDDPLLVCDDHGRIRLWNSAAKRVFHRSDPELRVAPLAELAGEPQAARILASLLHGRPVLHDVEMEFHASPAEPVALSVSTAILEDPVGEPAGVVIVGRDIREQKRVEAELSESQERLRDARRMEAIGRLAGGVAHDFNNLLTVIRGNTHLVLEEPAVEGDGPLRSAVAEIDAATERAADLTSQLLAFSRRQVLHPVVVDPRTAIREMEPMLRRLIRADIEIDISLDEPMGNIRVDPGQFDQVLMNLAANARDAMPSGGRLVIEGTNTVLDEAYAAEHPEVEPGAYVCISVSDTGDGMDQRTRDRIFEPFFTTKEAGQGTGLGLAMVYGIVRQSEGHIWVHSEPGMGTRFRICFPSIDAEPDRMADDGRTAGEESRATETILVVEDEPAVRALIRRVLEDRGYTVLVAENGPTAVRLGEGSERPIDLLLTDLVMPGMDGYEVADRLKHRFPAIKVVYTSGYTDEGVLRQGLIERRSTFLQKPFTPRQLTSRLRAALDAE